MKTRSTLILAVLAMILLGVVITLVSRKPVVPNPVGSPENGQPTEAVTSPGPSVGTGTGHVPNYPSAASASPAPRAYPSTPLSPPSLKDVREELERDSHHTPPALIRFAQDLAYRMTIARNSPEAAEALFSDLENCVIPKKGSEKPTVQAQTVCLNTAEELYRMDSERFRRRYEQLESQASGEVKRLQRAMKMLQ